jgi:hypothetical protein
MAKKTKKTAAKKAAAPKKAAAKKAAPKKAAPKKKAAAKKAAAPKEVLFVASKVKAYIKQSDKMTASETLEALNDKIYAMLDAAIKRTEGNGRKTVKPQDL